MIFYILLGIFLVSLIIYSVTAVIIIFHLKRYSLPGSRKTKILETAFALVSLILILFSLFILISLYPYFYD